MADLADTQENAYGEGAEYTDAARMAVYPTQGTRAWLAGLREDLLRDDRLFGALLHMLSATFCLCVALLVYVLSKLNYIYMWLGIHVLSTLNYIYMWLGSST